MKRNGMHALDFHGPALVDGHLTYLRGTRYVNRVVALCFLPYVGLLSADEIDRYAARFDEIGATLLIVSSSVRPLDRLWIGQLDKPNTPILADLCGRIHRSFGVAATERSARCHTFMIDRKGILRLRVAHDFVDRDLETLRKIVGLTDIHRANDEPDHEAATNKAEYVPV
jgi:alkyl hydroperoxide reductase subunit AhpC